jgi:ribosomal protein S18 acetylase RimI-like enzyme
MERRGVAIRPWRADDRDQVEQLLKLLSADAVVRADDALTFVAEADGHVVGMVTPCRFTTLTGPKAYLDHLVVASGFRRQGIGRALVLHAIDHAEAIGASRIDLTAGSAKHAGRALYHALGFRQRDTRVFRLELGPSRVPSTRPPA